MSRHFHPSIRASFYFRDSGSEPKVNHHVITKLSLTTVATVTHLQPASVATRGAVGVAMWIHVCYRQAPSDADNDDDVSKTGQAHGGDLQRPGSSWLLGLQSCHSSSSSS